MNDFTKLNHIHDNPGARKSRVRVGRGIGSGCGKTAGRGQKGQKSRSGVAIKGFEGGQMPLHMRLPKRGFNNIFRKDYSEINLGTLQAMIDAGRLDAGHLIDVQVLLDAGVLTHARAGVRLLAKGALTSKVTLSMAGASAAAKAAVEAAGGTLILPAPKPEPLSREEQKVARAVAREIKAARIAEALKAAK
jgi:large subunit ribosomal protein L15